MLRTGGDTAPSQKTVAGYERKEKISSCEKERCGTEHGNAGDMSPCRGYQTRRLTGGISKSSGDTTDGSNMRFGWNTYRE